MTLNVDIQRGMWHVDKLNPILFLRRSSGLWSLEPCGSCFNLRSFVVRPVRCFI